MEPTKPKPSLPVLLARVCGAVAVCVLAGCLFFRPVPPPPGITTAGVAPAGLSDANVLPDLGFAKPVTYDVETQFDDATTERLNDAAAFVAAGELELLPVLEGPVPWRLAASGPVDGVFATLPVGTRQVTGRSEERIWTEGNIQKYAETINYVITPTEGFKKAGLSSVGPFAIRVVFANDPAVGHWTYQATPLIYPDPTDGPSPEYSTLKKDLQRFGAAHVANYRTAVTEVLRKRALTAFNNIAATGTLINEPDAPMVAVSRKNSIAYYTGVQISQAMSLNEMAAYCSSLRTKKYGPWRNATKAEILSLMGTTPGINQGRLVDYPGGNILGGLGARSPDGRPVVLLTASVHSFEGDFPMTALPARLSGAALIGYSIGADGTLSDALLPYPDGTNTVMTQRLNFRKDFGEGRVICVSSIN